MSSVFDPFGDYDTAGYLRNEQQEKDLNLVKKLEQAHFKANVGRAINYAFKVKNFEQEHLLYIHKLLFGEFYPWAGKDRFSLESKGLLPPNSQVSKGSVNFLPASRIEGSLEHTFSRAKSTKFMNQSPGTIIGELAYAHPFLDGNGRTLLVVFNELCRRSDFSIDWSQTDKQSYLNALTQEIDNPSTGSLNNYLLPLKVKKKSIAEIEKSIISIRYGDSVIVSNYSPK